MILFEKCEAHPQEKLSRHLEETALLIQSSGSSLFKYVKFAILAGFLHDVGKATHFFQDYLKNKNKHGELSNHAILSAYIYLYSMDYCNLDNDKDYGALLGFLSIAKHHGDFNKDIPSIIATYRDSLESTKKDILLRQLENMDFEGVVRFINFKISEYDLPLQPIKPGSTDQVYNVVYHNFWSISSFGKNSFKRLIKKYPSFFLELYYFCGLLWQADKIHTATRRSHTSMYNIPYDLVPYFLKDIKLKNNYDQIRGEIHDKVLQQLEKLTEFRLFTLTAPTGSGKTLTLLDAALRHRFKTHGKRIIYCLPFTSIIEQNYDVFVEVLKKYFNNSQISENLLLKHHHLTSPVYQENDRQSDELTPNGQQLFVETWQSELVVTTFHQLLYTIFTSKNRNIKRFPQLSESIIILDEIQAIPVKYWEILGNVLSDIASLFQTTIILATATKPIIFDNESAVKELLPGHEYYYKKLARLQFVNRACPNGETIQTPFSNFLDYIIDSFTEDQSFLLVLNTKNAVKNAYKRIKESRIMSKNNIFLLSKSLTPEDRIEKIKTIKTKMKHDEKIIAISTQLIEAGVDLSFDIVHRDFAPLDCIVQTAGRCNRNWDESKQGFVYIWYLYDDAKEKPFYFSNIYDSVLLDITFETLGRFPVQLPESNLYELSQCYFCLAKDRAKGIESSVIKDKIKSMEFNDLEDQFRLIEDKIPTTTYFVVKNKQDQQLWDNYLDLKNINDPIQRKSQFQLFKSKFMQKTVDMYCKSKSQENIVLPAYMEMNQYSEEYGLNESSFNEGEGTFCL